MTPAQFPYVQRDPAAGVQGLAPLMPLTLARGGRSADVTALLDSGASLNVLPLGLGLLLGAAWDQQSLAVQLSGALGSIPAKGLVLTATVGSFASVKLVFAWVCFFRARSAFEVTPK